MTYLFLCSVYFGLLALHRSASFEWFTLAIMTMCVFVAYSMLGAESEMLYVVTPILTTMCATTLCFKRTKLGIYQATVLLLTLCAYAALTYDVSRGEHYLIYNYYEAVIYGLVYLQLAGSFPTLRTAYRDHISNNSYNLRNLQRNNQ